MKHLILGSKGQIGNYVVQAIKDRGEVAIEWDVVDGYDYDLADYNNYDKLVGTMKEVDFVHFLAFDVGGSAYLAKHQNSSQYIRTNMAIMDNTFAALQETKAPFYFASSQMENMPCTYGRLKALGETYTKEAGGFIVRFWNVYGYEPDPEKTHVITDFIKSALKDKQILCRTDGREQRNFVHAADAAASLLHIVDHQSRYNKNLHIPIYGEQVSIRYIAKIVKELIPGTEAYFTDKEDETQTVHNSPDGNPNTVRRNYYRKDIYILSEAGAPIGKFGELREGLKDIIKRIEQEQ